MRKLIEAHRFFVRKSQHYILGNWSEYEDFIQFVPDIGYVFNWKVPKYYAYYPIAYVKFMSYKIRDLLLEAKDSQRKI